MSLVALTSLLGILKVHHPFLPKDGRTLLKTATSYSIQNAAGGTYHYFGILKSLSKTLEKIWSFVPDKYAFKIQLIMDGLPLFKVKVK